MSPSSNDAQSPPPPSPPASPRRRDVPPPRGTARSSFDLEPNPFEQSFSATSGDGPDVPRRPPPPPASDDAPPKPKQPPDTPKPVLPSLAALSSPSDGYTWSEFAGSLRSGPLSPAMLQGPQQQPSAIPYDPARSFNRTNLTPSSGLTPLVGGPISFPPPSPNTAAFLAMVTNTSSATITPNTLSAITAIVPATAASAPAAPAAASSAAAPLPISNANTVSTAALAPSPQQPPPQSYPYPAQGYAPTSSANAATAAANGLFLLSQAHQELTKREEAQARAAHESSPHPKRPSKRKSIDVPSAPHLSSTSRTVTNKRPRANPTRARRGKQSVGSPDDDDDSAEDDQVGTSPVDDADAGPHANGTKKPETEEEKRRNFLERNRQAALKCRQRKKAWLAQLQAKVEFLTNENDRLTTALVSSREEISRLNALLGAAGPTQAGVASVASQPVSVSVTLPPAAKSVQAQAPQGPPVSVVANGRGYGY